jgi:hypothetical protein
MRLFDEHIAEFRASALGEFADSAPWELTLNAATVMERLLNRLADGYAISGTVALHHTATVEDGAVVKGPAIIGPHSFIAAGAYVRGGC